MNKGLLIIVVGGYFSILILIGKLIADKCHKHVKHHKLTQAYNRFANDQYRDTIRSNEKAANKKVRLMDDIKKELDKSKKTV